MRSILEKTSKNMKQTSQTFLKEYISFSRQNWWVYILLFFALFFVMLTGKGSSIEVFILFVLNLFGNICIMMMQNSYSEKSFSTGSLFLLFANVIFTGISLYGFFVNGEKQYLLYQISFNLSGIKTFLYYNYSYDIKFLNAYTLGIFNVLLFVFILFFLNLPFYGNFQSLGFAAVTLGLVVIDDIWRYFLNVFGIIFIVLWSFLGLYWNYISGNILGITVSYSLLTTTVFIFYLKLLPQYLKALKF